MNMWHIHLMKAFYATSEMVENMTTDLKIVSLLGYAALWSVIYFLAS